MRCQACDKKLNDFESTRKSAVTGQYLDLCNGCFGYIKHDIDTLERPDLIHQYDDDEEVLDDDVLYEDNIGDE